MKRKSVTYLNELRRDVDNVLSEIYEIGIDIEAAAGTLARRPASDLQSNDDDCKDEFNSLVASHKELGKQLKAFRKVRMAYLDFF